MRIYFLTEYSKEIGFGHLSRCLSLASVFHERNYEVIFLIREWKQESLELNFESNKVEWADTNVLDNIISEEDILVMDSYRVPSENLHRIAVNHEKTVSITDSKLNHASAGVIVCGSVYGKEFRNISNKALVLAGPEFLLFRKEVRESPRNEVRKNIQQVLINLGGHADSSVLKKIISLLQAQLDNCTIRIVGNSNLENSKQVCNLGFLSLSDLLGELKETDIVVSNGGQSLNEVVLLGIPTIGVSVADNQDKNIRSWQELGVLKHFVKSTSPDFRQKFMDSLVEIKDYNIRLGRVKKGYGLIDSNGVKRVADKIEEWAKINT